MGKHPIIPIFLQKSHALMEKVTAEAPHVATWCVDQPVEGDAAGVHSFVVTKPSEFAADWIPLFFAHNKFSSWTRQLNFYNFEKFDSRAALPPCLLIADEQSSKKIKDATLPKGEAPISFSHPRFVQGKPELLIELKDYEKRLKMRQEEDEAKQYAAIAAATAVPAQQLTRLNQEQRAEMDRMQQQVESLESKVLSLTAEVKKLTTKSVSQDQINEAVLPSYFETTTNENENNKKRKTSLTVDIEGCSAYHNHNAAKPVSPPSAASGPMAAWSNFKDLWNLDDGNDNAGNDKEGGQQHEEQLADDNYEMEILNFDFDANSVSSGPLIKGSMLSSDSSSDSMSELAADNEKSKQQQQQQQQQPIEKFSVSDSMETSKDEKGSSSGSSTATSSTLQATLESLPQELQSKIEQQIQNSVSNIIADNLKKWKEEEVKPAAVTTTTTTELPQIAPSLASAALGACFFTALKQQRVAAAVSNAPTTVPVLEQGGSACTVSV